MKGWDDAPEPRPWETAARHPGPQTGSYTQDWTDACDEARQMREAVLAAAQAAAAQEEPAGPRHARRHVFPRAVVRAAAVVLIAAGTLLVTAGTAVAAWLG